MAKSSKTIFTFGHSAKPLAIFLNKLADHKIEILVDVRTFPRSRFCPHYNAKPLGNALAERNIIYLYRGRNVGGRGENVKYEETIDELSEMTKNGKRICVMCSEGNYQDCHRYSTLTPSFQGRGLKVVHIKYDPKTDTKNEKRISKNKRREGANGKLF